MLRCAQKHVAHRAQSWRKRSVTNMAWGFQQHATRALPTWSERADAASRLTWMDMAGPRMRRAMATVHSSSDSGGSARPP